jgi:hypothetical protein
VFNTSSGDHCIDQNSQSGQSPNMLFHSVAGAETFVKKHTAQHQDATSEEQFSTDTSLKVAHKRFGEREDNPDKSSKERKNLSVLEVYLEYTIREISQPYNPCSSQPPTLLGSNQRYRQSCR